MLLESKNYNKEVAPQDIKTINTYLVNDTDIGISHTAKYKGFQLRTKVESLRFFVA